MKIIKVVHENIPDKQMREKYEFAIDKFDVEAFVKEMKDGKMIVSRSQAFAAETAFGLLNLIADKKDIENLSGLKDLDIKIIINSLLEKLKSDVGDIEIVSLDSVAEKYPRTKNITVGTFTLHPYDDGRLTPIEQFHKTLASEKDHELIMLLGKMQAKEIHIFEQNTNTTSFSGEFNTDMPLGSVNAKIKNLKSSGSQKEFLVTFEGNREKIDPNLLKTSLMFSHDSLLNSILISQCSQNKIESYTLKNTYNETYDFDLAGRYLVYKVDLKAEYQEAKNIERLFHVEFSKKS